MSGGRIFRPDEMGGKSKRFLFIVQGEGRGHMTQAISLFEMLRDAGHEVGHVVVGRSSRRELPAFFESRITAPVTGIRSPNFVADKSNKSVKIGPTITHNLAHFTDYVKSLRQLDGIVKETKPDVIVNFYDFLGGLYNGLYKPKAGYVCIGHQYLANHGDFPFPQKTGFNKNLLLNNNKLTAWGADKLLALSFAPYAPLPGGGVAVVPPLLRKEIKNLTPEAGDFILTYMVNDGYSKEIEAWHQRHPEVRVQSFWDKKGMPDPYVVDDTLTFHQLSDTKFLELMRTCKAYVSTAGFESICEAMYLGKPVMMVPVQGHYEQMCNALDARKAGAGISSTSFDLSLVIDYLPHHQPVADQFRAWADQCEELVLKELCG